MQYETWVKEVNLWSLCCKLDKQEQGPALALSLTGHARQAAMDIDTTVMNSDQGLQSVINKLNGLYLKDVNQRIYVALKNFECYKRSADTSMDNFLNQFDLRYNKLKAHGIVLPDVVLGYRMIESANLNQSRNELVRISAGCMSYDEIKKQLRKLEDIAASSSMESMDNMDIKTEDPGDVLFQYDHYSNRGGYRGRGRGGRGTRGGVHFQSRGGRGGNHVSNYGARGAPRGRGSFRGRGRGACFGCGKRDHHIQDCPDVQHEGAAEEGGEVEDVEIVDVEI